MLLACVVLRGEFVCLFVCFVVSFFFTNAENTWDDLGVIPEVVFRMGVIR